MAEPEILIIGAGASGLIAARQLAKSGRTVSVLEARNRIGGRIHTLSVNGFAKPIETGAEFVHGRLPITLSILKDAGIQTSDMQGITYQLKDGSLQQSEEFIEGFPELISRMKQLKKDLPFEEFLDTCMKEENFKQLKEEVKRYAEGYDAADIRRVSSFALLEEWTSEADSTPSRIVGGYTGMTDFLASECREAGCPIHLSAIVKEIRWRTGHAEIICSNNQIFHSSKVLITVPLGILHAERDSKARIKFSPEIPQFRPAVMSMGFGEVIKVFFEFKETFWENNSGEPKLKQMPGLGFLISDAPVTTWWTQAPDKLPLLTGWMAGPKAGELRNLSNEEIIRKAMDSLAYIFDTDLAFINKQMKAFHAANWMTDPFTLGAYSYATVHSEEAVRVLTAPVNDTLYFAGEALYAGPAMGTVEAALSSALNAVKII